MKKIQRMVAPVFVMALLMAALAMRPSNAIAISQPSATSFHFVFTADSRDDYTVLPVLSQKMVTLNPVFGAFGGDLCGSFSTTCINNTWKPALDGNNSDGILAKTFVIRGNHDNGTLSTWQGLWDFQTMAANVGATNFTAQTSNATYSFDYGNSHFSFLDVPGGDISSWSSAEISWLDSDLTAAEGRGVAHEFVFAHGPVYGVTAQHGSAVPSSALKAVLNKHPISATFAGHEHVTQYTYVTSSKVSGINGIQEFTLGRSGAPAYSVTKPVDWSASQNAFADIAVNGNDFTVTVYGQSGSALFSKTFTDGGPSATATPSPVSSPTSTSQPTSGPTATATKVATATATKVSTATATKAATATATQVSTTTATKAPSATPTMPSGQSATFLPAADAYVNSAAATTNYGTLTTLRVDGSPDVHSYLRFNVSGLGGRPITGAHLRIYANSASTSGMQAEPVADNSWSESAVTFNNAPALGSVLSTSPAVSTGTWVTLDVTSYVTAEGTFSLGVNTAGATAISLASRESGANAPKLVVDLGSAGTAIPTQTSAPSATPTVVPATTVAPSATPTDTAVPATTAAPSATPTDTPVPATTAAPSPTPTDTAVPATTAAPSATPANTATPTATVGAGQPVTFLPIADAYVNSAAAATNYGTLTTLRVDGSPDVHSYLRFNVSALGGKAITRVRLLIYANSASTSGMQAERVADNSWSESAVTFNNAPALGSVLSTSPAVSTGTWVTLDVTSYVTAEGTYNFGVSTAGVTAISLASREAGANSPKLIVDLAP